MKNGQNRDPGFLYRAQETLISTAVNLSRLPGVIFDIKMEVSLIRGKIPGTDQDAIMCYVGRGPNLIYLKGKMLADAQVVSTEKTNVFSYRPVWKAVEDRADFTFIDLGLPYQKSLIKNADGLELPDWINMVIPLAEEWEQVERGFNKTTRKLIRRNPYQAELSHDPDVIRRFYDDFYLPYLTYRHEDAAVEPRWAVERRARQGGILRVMQEGEPVVAGVVYPENDVLYYLWLGMPERYLENQPEGALFASYYFCLKYAYDNSFAAANWMGTRGFPTDGVFQFKRKWGAHVEDSFSPDAVLFKPAASNRKAIEFAEATPLLARRNGKLELLLCTTAETLTDMDMGRMLSAYLCEGVDQVTIAHVSDDHQIGPVIHSDAFPNVRIIKTDVAGFATLYDPGFETPGRADTSSD